MLCLRQNPLHEDLNSTLDVSLALGLAVHAVSRIRNIVKARLRYGLSALKADSVNDTTATLTYTMTALSDVTLRVFYVGFRFPVANLIGHEYQLDDDPPHIFPAKMDKTHLARKAVSKLTIGTKFGPIVLRFHKPTKLLLQDDRQWAETFLLRVAPAGETQPAAPAYAQPAAPAPAGNQAPAPTLDDMPADTSDDDMPF